MLTVVMEMKVRKVLHNEDDDEASEEREKGSGCARVL
jgi:hypothetical protein